LCLSACPGDKKSQEKIAAHPLEDNFWNSPINIGKCKAISYSRRPELNTNYSISDVTVKILKILKI